MKKYKSLCCEVDYNLNKKDLTLLCSKCGEDVTIDICLQSHYDIENWIKRTSPPPLPSSEEKL